MEIREKSSRLIILIFFLPFLIWVLLQFLAPFAIPQSTIDDLSGITGVSDNEQLTDEMPAPWGSIYGCGDRLCHQKEERSFFINGNQMPFCARCTAIWIGLAIGLGFMVFYKIEFDGKFIYLIIIGLAPIGIDGVGQLFGLWESNNIVRLITGLLIGIVVGIAIGIIIDEIIELKKRRVKG
jgi:uncharacterized membrane protein